MYFKKEVETALNEKISCCTAISGGCINDTYKITTVNEEVFFLKTNSNAPSNMFEEEAKGLAELKKTNTIKVPDVIYHSPSMIILEFIRTGKKRNNFSYDFGKQLANHHKIPQKSWGYSSNNYIGLSKQINTPLKYQKETREKDWADFFWNDRILFQFKLAEKNGLTDFKLSNLIGKLENTIVSILAGSGGCPAILHGDLWGGNYMINSSGGPVLIDPAVYFGHREADLAMTKIFGGFDHNFYQGYMDTYPLKPGFKKRENIYKLYHIINHLNLFGHSYYGQCIDLLRYYFSDFF